MTGAGSGLKPGNDYDKKSGPRSPFNPKINAFDRPVGLRFPDFAWFAVGPGQKRDSIVACSISPGSLSGRAKSGISPSLPRFRLVRCRAGPKAGFHRRFLDFAWFAVGPGQKRDSIVASSISLRCIEATGTLSWCAAVAFFTSQDYIFHFFIRYHSCRFTLSSPLLTLTIYPSQG
jgi:hypothetical protein